MTEMSVMDIVRYVVSVGINMASFILILFGIAMGYVTLPGHPVAHYIIFFVGLTVLGYFEGLQVAILELEKVEFTQQMVEIYPRAKILHDMCHTPKDVGRFLVGRQFGVIFVVFLLSQTMTLPHLPRDLFPGWIYNIFIDTGLPGAFVALTFAQLPLQLLGQLNPYFVLNLPGAWFVLWYTFIINDIGAAHSCYIAALVTDCITKYTTKPGGIPDANGKEMSTADYVRYVVGAITLLGSTCVIFYGIGSGYAVFPAHPVVNFIILSFCMTLLAFLEGLQICILTLEHATFPQEYRSIYPRAYQLYQKAASGEGENFVTKFLVGRQFFVIFVFMFLSQITTYPSWPRTGLPSGLYTLILDTGLPGAVLTTCIGSLLAQLINQRNPYWAMNIIGSWYIYLLTLATEWIGVAHFAYVVIKGILLVSGADKKPGCLDLNKAKGHGHGVEVEMDPLQDIATPTASPEESPEKAESPRVTPEEDEMIHG